MKELRHNKNSRITYRVAFRIATNKLPSARTPCHEGTTKACVRRSQYARSMPRCGRNVCRTRFFLDRPPNTESTANSSHVTAGAGGEDVSAKCMPTFSNDSMSAGHNSRASNALSVDPRVLYAYGDAFDLHARCSAYIYHDSSTDTGHNPSSSDVSHQPRWYFCTNLTS